MHFKKFLRLIHFPQIVFGKININHSHIRVFNILSERSTNDENNKMREIIISLIINRKIPDDFYTLGMWVNLREKIQNYISELCDNKPYNNITCTHKAGRNNNYDFLFTLFYDDKTTKDYHIEFKYGAQQIEDAPQFVSPMKPSKYLSNSFEEHYYENYLPTLAKAGQLNMPKKEEYLKQIHSNKPPCLKEYQELYYKGCSNSSKFINNEKYTSFYELSKKLSNESIQEFIQNTELNTELLSSYLYNTQKDKIYMLYFNKEFKLQKVDLNDYIIVSVNKNPNKNRYECISKTGKKMNVLLRWKNGNGIAFPAFQIS